MRKYILQFSLLILASGCITYGNFTKSQLISVTEYQCSNKSDTLNIFFEGETIDFEYDQIGLVKVEGKRYTNDQQVLDHLKFQAWKNCADAIINVSIGSTIREQGLLFDVESDDQYASTVFTGLAVRIRKDTTFSHQNYPYTTRDTFVKTVKSELKKESDNSTAEVALSIVGLTALVIFVAAQ
ncbi:MAG: hypothetical protein ABJF11_04055 [Reichenbachiella sp.]|uniref:hypothetical protein n=1 Tax=Reichenbachiella sp. TaxID=2184521 RepID=UPI003263C03A